MTDRTIPGLPSLRDELGHAFGRGTLPLVDTSTLVAGSNGRFAEYLDKPNGASLKGRAGDNVHFERADGDMIARQVIQVLNRTHDLTSWRRASS